MRRIAVALALWLLASQPAASARAQDVHVLLTGYSLASWTQKDGLSSSLIWALAQDRAGYLWLGTDAGIMRFDGVRFVAWDAFATVPSPTASVRSLCVTRDGALWFGLGEPGGIGVLRDGRVTMYGAAEGLPAGVVMALAETPDGTLWAGGRFGVYRRAADRWARGDDGVPAGFVNALLTEADGTLTAATAEGVYARTGPAGRFSLTGRSIEPARSLARGGDGRLWVTDPIVGFRPVLAGHTRPLALQKGRGARLKYDSRGNLWVGTGGQGLWRLRHDAAGTVHLFERTSTRTGLSDDGVTELLEDREGNIWVATRDGLNRLTPYKMTPIMDLGIVNAVDVTPDGRVWVGTADALVAFAAGEVEARAPPIAVPEPPLAAMHADPYGTLWVATAATLRRVVRDRTVTVPLRGAELRQLSDLTTDGAGGLWIHDEATGLWHWRDGRLTPAPVPPELQPVPLLASYTDSGGRAWFAYANGRVATIDRDKTVRVAGEGDGLTAGPYRAIHQDRSGAVWLGGNRGLSRFADGTFRTLPAIAAEAARPIVGIVDDSEGHLWLAMETAGIVRIARDEVLAVLDDPGHRLRYTAYDKVDGSAGMSRWFGHRSAVRANADRLWFVAGRGVTVVDAAALVSDTPPASALRIEGAVADGRRVATDAAAVLPARTARLQIDYTALTLTSPLKTKFLHRLEGFDADWVDAGTGRSASYTNLPPRSYTFRVMATGADGMFGDAGAAWAFRIRPMFHETWWFVGLCATAVACGIGLAWRVHVLRVRRQFALLLGERARLSREVHDTLLQSMFGFALQVDALGAAVATTAPEIRDRLAGLRHQVEEDIREARQSIWNLRSPRLEARDLAAALKDAAEHAASTGALQVTFTTAGTPRPIATAVEEQLLRIGREAMANVVRHAHARELRIALVYGVDDMTLTVTDDGCGFDVAPPASDYAHFGLVAMRERAESVHGSLNVESRVGSGTTVTAVIPEA